MPDGKTLVFLILVFACAATAAQSVWSLVVTAKVRRQMNTRLMTRDRKPDLADLVLELRKQRGLSASGERQGWLWLTDLITQSGVPFDARRWALIIAGGTLAATAVAFIATKTPAAALFVFLISPILGPIGFLKVKAAHRATQLGLQLPNALEVVVRSLEAGHPVPTAIALVGREMADPIGSEFGMAADEIAYGATLEQAVGRIAERCRHPDIDLFAATIRLQERAGGNLTGLLKMNAHTVRERHKMRLKIKAAASEGRVSAIILTSAPIAVFTLIQVASPRFYGDIIGETPVQMGLGFLGTWMFIGNLVMRRMINMRI